MGYPKRKPRKPKKRNPVARAEKRMLATAKRLSKRFHGRSEVVELSPRERRPLPRYMVVAGELDEFTYAPDKRSKLGAAKYSHKVGDGSTKPRGRKKPLIVVDPGTKRPAILLNGSGMKFSSARGFVG